MHGADFDVRLIDRDLGIRVARLFDTQIAASLLGVEALGLSFLLENRLGIKLSKKYQKADWAQRPLPPPMREYAALDTIHLLALADHLRDELVERGRLEWAVEEFRELEKVRFEAPNGRDPVLGMRGVRDLLPRGSRTGPGGVGMERSDRPRTRPSAVSSCGRWRPRRSRTAESQDRSRAFKSEGPEPGARLRVG